ncbi:HIT family protein [Sulfurospirillum barnesii]|uniref:HIT family hydrolase, diadenosine tetraphosphate hydrolase n=1 Tax=Sulfurospirillum barnesii (strain ATCC 700032 / DSM 10660 / SES-3) TaxID=760154 RepID=I3XYM6_SULBS|nr:HIT family protein [Sulfurospirillum barnesii]AFL69050.1 HIT family hydrolase, diadenosine tetraphosphate hydrolase [Sulfurospirillum barnesii SES-3]
MANKLYENEIFYIEKEEATIPWVKIFPHKAYKELSDCDPITQQALLHAMLCVEEVMKTYYSPKKINIALFGNYVPHLHIHIMARFEDDSHFPESMWGVKQREGRLWLPPFEDFVTLLCKKLSKP